MAAAPSYSEAAGVTESGMFSQSDDDLNSRGFEIHMSRDNINLDKLNSLFVMVSAYVYSTIVTPNVVSQLSSSVIPCLRPGISLFHLN
jgi:hypothetical protein